jgi:MFS family permease
VSLEWWITLPTDVRTVSATAVASGAISSARYLYFANGQPKRPPLRERCFNAGLVAISGAVIGSLLAAALYSPDYPLRTFGLSGALAICMDPMNLTATRNFLVRFVRALAMLPRQLELDGEQEQRQNSAETCESQAGPSSSSEDRSSEPAQ